MTLGYAALVKIVIRYIRGLFDPRLCMIEVDKLMYFMRVADRQVRRICVENPYSPCAESLFHAFCAIEGYMVSGYADGGDAPDNPLKLESGAEFDADFLLNAYADTRPRLGRLSALMDSVESPYGLELLDMVHWAVKEAGERIDDSGIVVRMRARSQRVKQFTSRQIGIALDALGTYGWIKGAAA